MNHESPSFEDHTMTPEETANVWFENVIRPNLLILKENGRVNEIEGQLDRMLVESPDGLGDEAKEILRQRRNEFLADILVTA